MRPMGLGESRVGVSLLPTQLRLRSSNIDLKALKVI